MVRLLLSNCSRYTATGDVPPADATIEIFFFVRRWVKKARASSRLAVPKEAVSIHVNRPSPVVAEIASPPASAASPAIIEAALLPPVQLVSQRDVTYKDQNERQR